MKNDQNLGELAMQKLSSRALDFLWASEILNKKNQKIIFNLTKFQENPKDILKYKGCGIKTYNQIIFFLEEFGGIHLDYFSK